MILLVPCDYLIFFDFLLTHSYHPQVVVVFIFLFQQDIHVITASMGEIS